MNAIDNPVYRLRYEAYRREEFVPFNDRDRQRRPRRHAECLSLRHPLSMASWPALDPHPSSGLEHRKGRQMKSAWTCPGRCSTRPETLSTRRASPPRPTPCSPIRRCRSWDAADRRYGDRILRAATEACSRWRHPEHGRSTSALGAEPAAMRRPGLAFPVVLTARIRRSTCSRFTCRHPFFRSTRSRITRRSTCVDLRCRSRPQALLEEASCPIVRPSAC